MQSVILAAAVSLAMGLAEPRAESLRVVLDEHVEWLMREYPELASRRGDERYNDRLTDVSPAASDRRAREKGERLARLRALPRADFTEEDHLDADLLIYELDLDMSGVPLHFEQMPLNALEGPHVGLPQLCDQIPLRSEKHLSDYAARLDAVPAYIDQTIEQMRAGAAAGRVPPRVVLAKTLAGVQGFAKADAPEHTPFFKPFLGRPEGDALAARAKKAISEKIAPAFGRLAAYLEEYIPKCRETLGISEGVDGPKAYDWQLRYHTTLPLQAQEIHDLGVREVARLRADMLATIDETDWPQRTSFAPGQDDAKFAAFLQYLRSDPRFYYEHAPDMMRGYRDLCKRIDPELPRLFKTLPRLTYGVREIPRFAAPASPAAYCYPGSIRSGVPGYFMVNTYAMDQRPRYGMVSLTIHEAVPGHHFQLAIADELEGLHRFRSLVEYTAYVEGWALYAERLGLEMGEGPRGFYTDPYDNFGRLSDEIWRACRLVVDTGLHRFGWSRQRAIDYMLANSAGTELDTISEVDRYIGWPGQACAYKIGQLKILELRHKAEKALGASFDVRAFHDAVLLGGALPMPVLERRVERWIAGGGR